MELIFQAQQLSKKYKTQTVVKSANINIPRGAIYGFVGENGAGKTTIIRMMTGLTYPSKGSFTLFNIKNSDSHINKARQKIAAIVETPSINLTLSAYDNLKYQCLLFNINQDKITDILSLVGLSYLHKSKKNAGHFSLGMRQRLSIGMALITNPEFIILDEPMNGLDPQGIVEVRNLISKLNKELGITFLISSHILNELARIATHYCFIHKGVILKEMTSADLALECKKATILITNDNEKALPILKQLGYCDYRLHNEEISIYDEVAITPLVIALDQQGINVNKLYLLQNDIEDYYMKLMKGENHD